MESSRTASTSSNGSEKSRRRATDYLQIDPSSTFMNTTGRFVDDMPENFLDTISPHPVTSSVGSSSGTSSAPDDPPTSSAPQLAALAPMTISTEQPSSSFSSASLLSYHVKNEQEYTPSTGSLLSPLQVDSRRRESTDYDPSPYIKEEEDLDNAHLLLSGLRQAELDEISGRDPSPSDRSGELASIDSLMNGDHHRTPSPQSSYGGDPTQMIQRQLIKNEEDVGSVVSSTSSYTKPGRVYAKARHNGDRQQIDFEKAPYQRNSRKQKKPLGVLNQAASSSSGSSINVSTPSVNSSSAIPTPPSAHVVPSARRIYSTQDSNDPLNAEIGEDIYIDTKDLCRRIAFELKNHSIPQAIFAERILCRSQGTLSDLLRNPKPWNKLKSGRETFRRMFNWVSQPLATRLAILDMKTEEVNRASGMSPPTPAQNVRTHSSRKSTSDNEPPASKRPRLVFTDIQKRTLQAIFKETQRPSREMQQTIAEHLRLDLSTVANFFMNARRRSRLGVNIDEPTPFQQVRNVSPPPSGESRMTDGVHGPLLTTVMNGIFKDDEAEEHRRLIARGFGVTSAETLSHALATQNGQSHGEEDDEEEELNGSEMVYEEEADRGDEEDEEEETTNGDLVPPKAEIEERIVKEEMPDDGEYGRSVEQQIAAAGM